MIQQYFVRLMSSRFLHDLMLKSTVYVFVCFKADIFGLKKVDLFLSVSVSKDKI